MEKNKSAKETARQRNSVNGSAYPFLSLFSFQFRRKQEKYSLMVNNKKKRNKPRLGRNWNWARIGCNRGENDYAATSRPKFLQKRDRVGATKENGNFRFGLINRTKKKGTKTKNSSLTRIRFDRVTRIRPISIFRGVRK